jgi:hypothetical protein
MERTGTAVRQERKSRREEEGQRCRTYSTVPVRRTRLRFRPVVIDSRMFPSSTGSPPSDLVLPLSFCLIQIGVRPRESRSPSISALSLGTLGLCGRSPIPSSCLSLRRQGSFSLWRRDSGAEASALVCVSPLPSMASRLRTWQNVQGQVPWRRENKKQDYNPGVSPSCILFRTPDGRICDQRFIVL